jgi:hypothetical protein
MHGFRSRSEKVSAQACDVNAVALARKDGAVTEVMLDLASHYAEGVEVAAVKRGADSLYGERAGG